LQATADQDRTSKIEVLSSKFEFCERIRFMGYGVRTPLADYPAQRVAIVKPSALGDIIHSLPVLTAVRERYPEAYIAWIVNRNYADLLRGHPDLDAVLPLDRGAARGSPWRAVVHYGSFFNEVRKQNFDLIIDLQGLLRSGLMSGFSGAARRVGLSTAREFSTWFYTDVVQVADFNAIHAVDRCWLIAQALGMGDRPKRFRLHIPEDARLWATQTLSECARPWIMAGVGARWKTKRWPPEHFAALTRRALDLAGGTVFCVGGRDETPLAQAMGAHLGHPVRDLTGRTSLPQLAALLRHADVMISNDTGPLHLAAALGRPVVAPYTCTKVLLNGPYGGEAGAVETEVWCQGSYLKRCRRLECMLELTPERLWPALERILHSWQSNSLTA
jgi:lipopolysaccharide heptosyltransferase I